MRDKQRAMDVKTFAEQMGIGRNLAYEAIRQGLIPHIRIGSRILIPIEALEQTLRETGK